MTEGPFPSSYVDVACTIAEGRPPEWLVLALKDAREVVGSGMHITPEVYREYKKRCTECRKAVKTLMALLPLFDKAPILTGFEESLPGLKDWLDKLSQKPAGRRPHFGRELCADLICFYWKLVHGKAKPRSDKLYHACEEYWRICGGEPSGDIENWRRMVEAAAARPDPLSMHNMLMWKVGGTKLSTK
jgi:hypothetical protein